MPGIDLSVRIANLYLSCFWMNASGSLGKPEEYARFSNYMTGAVVSKTSDRKELMGNPTPDFTQLDDDTFSNSIGLHGPGVVETGRELGECRALIKRPFIQSIKPQETPKATGEMAAYVAEEYKPNGIELNAGCPNVPGGMVVGQDPRLTEEHTQACRDAVPGTTLIVKLTPNMVDYKIGDIAKAAFYDGGADILAAINTVLDVGMDYSKGRSVLGRPPGGLSGRKILPIGLECVGQICLATNKKAPIIGIGGIKEPDDAIQYLMRGATAVAMCTYLVLDRPMELETICDPTKTTQRFLEDFGSGMMERFKALSVTRSEELRGRHFRRE